MHMQSFTQIRALQAQNFDAEIAAVVHHYTDSDPRTAMLSCTSHIQAHRQGERYPLPKTLTLIMTKICDIPSPIYDLTKNSKPYL